MDAIFGTEFPLLVKFVISFAVVLILIGIGAFLLRRFGSKALTRSASRSAQPRLAVVDIAPIDDRRNLVIVRRDNVEHLLLIGGPTDLLVEPNISSAAVQPAREPDVLSRTAATSAPSWAPGNANWPPAAPEVTPRVEPGQKPEPRIDVRAEPALHSEPVIMPEPFQRQEPRIQTVPAFESSVVVPAVKPVAASTDVLQASVADLPSARAAAQAPPQDLDTHHERMNGAGPVASNIDVNPPQPTAPKGKAGSGQPPLNEDQNLADMAQRLEAALRRPLAGSSARVTPHGAPRSLATPVLPAAETAPAVAIPIAVPATPPQAAAPAASQAPPPVIRDENGSYETLQREMASLLGRKPGSS